MTALDVTAAIETLEELRTVEIELAARAHARRSHAREGAREAIRRIGETGSPDTVLDGAAGELGARSAFDRVLISRVDDGTLHPHAGWESGGGDLAQRLAGVSIPLAYPLVEADVLGHDDARVVDVADSGRRTPTILRERLGWTSYVVVALTLHGNAIGMLHADAMASGRDADEVDRGVASLYARGLSRCFELAALRRTLRHHRDEQRSAVHWMNSQLERADASDPLTAPSFGSAEIDPLTPREREVIELMARGMTNGAIATALTISEGTAKYHVANVLSKLRATSRADAVARHLRGEG